jgi:sugar lactone lactonase YvrE
MYDGVVHEGWVKDWYVFWRDHDPDDITPLNAGALPTSDCKSCGSVDGVAYFPAAFDRKTGKLSVTGVATVVRPGVDTEGRPTLGGSGTLTGNLSNPTDVEIDSQGNVYVIDSRFRRLTKYDAAGNVLTAIPIKVEPARADEQSEPWGLAIGPDGTIVVADTFGWRVRVFDAALQPVSTFGKPAPSNQVPGPLDFFGPRDVAIDREGLLWITDTGHDRILVFDRLGGFVKEFGKQGTGPGEFDEPVGISIGGDGTIFVADMYNGRVVLLGPDGAYRSEFPVDGWGGKGVEDKPYLEALRDGRIALSVPALQEVRLYDRSGGLSATITGGAEPLSKPYGIAQTADGKLWIVEAGVSRVRQFALP